MARVYTQRMQDVLVPIATSIAALISKIEESEETGATLSDLSGPSAAVQSACHGLANAGRSLCDGSDPVLGRDMPPAANALDDTARKMHEACVTLKTSPNNAAAKKQLEGMSGVFIVAQGLTLLTRAVAERGWVCVSK